MASDTIVDTLVCLIALPAFTELLPKYNVIFYFYLVYFQHKTITQICITESI